MKINRTHLLIATVAGLVGVLIPMLPVPFSNVRSAQSCAIERQMTELSRYGYVKVHYNSMFDSDWTAKFSKVDDGVYLTVSVVKDSLCDAVDELYYKVLEHPLSPN